MSAEHDENPPGATEEKSGETASPDHRRKPAARKGKRRKPAVRRAARKVAGKRTARKVARKQATKAPGKRVGSSGPRPAPVASRRKRSSSARPATAEEKTPFRAIRRGRRVRRSRQSVEQAAFDRAQGGAFTPTELAGDIGFTSNRARQLLEELKVQGKIVPLGTRRGGRGKPATLWGFPGTNLTEADTVVRSVRARAERIPRAQPGDVGGGAKLSSRGRGFLDRLWQALQMGIEIRTPDGGTYQVRLME